MRYILYTRNHHSVREKDFWALLFALDLFNRPLSPPRPFELSTLTHWISLSMNRAIDLTKLVLTPVHASVIPHPSLTKLLFTKKFPPNKENAYDIQIPSNTLTPPRSPLVASPVTIEALYNSQRLLVLQYKDEFVIFFRGSWTNMVLMSWILCDGTFSVQDLWLDDGDWTGKRPPDRRKGRSWCISTAPLIP